MVSKFLLRRKCLLIFVQKYAVAYGGGLFARNGKTKASQAYGFGVPTSYPTVEFGHLARNHEGKNAIGFWPCNPEITAPDNFYLLAVSPQQDARNHHE